MIIFKILAITWWLWPLLLVLWCALLGQHLRKKPQEEDEETPAKVGSTRHNRAFLLGMSLIVLLVGGMMGALLRVFSSTLLLGILLS